MDELPLTDESFRIAASRYATGIVVVTTVVDGMDHAMTATSFTTVSLDPMLALVCVESDTRFREALAAARDEQWAISILPATARPIASWFATKGRPLLGQFDRVGHHRGPRTGAILLDDALATMEFQTVREIVAGDHLIVIGEVLSLACAESSSPADELVAQELPLVYWARRYRGLLP